MIKKYFLEIFLNLFNIFPLRRVIYPLMSIHIWKGDSPSIHPSYNFRTTVHP